MTPQEAQELLKVRYREISDIEYQLADPNKTDRNGQRLTDDEYKAWRKKALAALKAKKDETFELKEMLDEHRDTISRKAAGIFSQLLEEGVEFDREEREVIEYFLKIHL